MCSSDLQGVYDDRAALDAATEKVAGALVDSSPLAVQFLKRIVREGRDMTVEQQWRFSEMFSFTVGRTEDAEESRRAASEKRRPAWKGR